MSGNQTKDSEIVAFGATVQAYGVWRLGNPEMKPLIIQYLTKAITEDPSWEYPKELLDEVGGKEQQE